MVLQACRIEQPPDSEELLPDQANHVEAIGDDQSTGENLSNQRPTGRRQVHANEHHPLCLISKIGFPVRS